LHPTNKQACQPINFTDPPITIKQASQQLRRKQAIKQASNEANKLDNVDRHPHYI